MSLIPQSLAINSQSQAPARVSVIDQYLPTCVATVPDSLGSQVSQVIPLGAMVCFLLPLAMPLATVWCLLVANVYLTPLLMLLFALRAN